MAMSMGGPALDFELSERSIYDREAKWTQAYRRLTASIASCFLRDRLHRHFINHHRHHQSRSRLLLLYLHLPSTPPIAPSPSTPAPSPPPPTACTSPYSQDLHTRPACRGATTTAPPIALAASAGAAPHARSRPHRQHHPHSRHCRRHFTSAAVTAAITATATSFTAATTLATLTTVTASSAIATTASSLSATTAIAATLTMQSLVRGPIRVDALLQLELSRVSLLPVATLAATLTARPRPHRRLHRHRFLRCPPFRLRRPHRRRRPLRRCRQEAHHRLHRRARTGVSSDTAINTAPCMHATAVCGAQNRRHRHPRHRPRHQSHLPHRRSLHKSLHLHRLRRR